MRYVRILGLVILGTLFPGAKVTSADTFSYELTTDAFTQPGVPTLNSWSASWQSNQLLIPSSLIELSLQPGFTPLGAPAAGYSLFSLVFGRTGSGIDEMTAEWDPIDPSLPQIFYTAHFSAVTPPETTGTFPATDTLIQHLDGFQPGPPMTLTITEMTVVPEPATLALLGSSLIGLMVALRRTAESSRRK